MLKEKSGIIPLKPKGHHFLIPLEKPLWGEGWLLWQGILAPEPTAVQHLGTEAPRSVNSTGKSLCHLRKEPWG